MTKEEEEEEGSGRGRSATSGVECRKIKVGNRVTLEGWRRQEGRRQEGVGVAAATWRNYEVAVEVVAP